MRVMTMVMIGVDAPTNSPLTQRGFDTAHAVTGIWASLGGALQQRSDDIGCVCTLSGAGAPPPEVWIMQRVVGLILAAGTLVITAIPAGAAPPGAIRDRVRGTA